jgi:hypothetical protein
VIITTYKCDACGEECKDKDITIIADFPRRKYEYARDALGVKIVGFSNITFDETHLCQKCLQKILNFTNIIEA